MAKQIINVGARNNDGTGDSLRVGATKVNDNFSEIYNLLGDGENLSVVSRITAGIGLAVGNNTGAVLITGRIASGNDLGMIKVGENLTISQDGTLSAQQTEYVLPTASSTVLGGVKVGLGLAINQGVLSNTVSAYTLPTASTSLLGGVKVDGTSITINNGVISGSNQYSLPTATDSILGGIKIGAGLSISQGVVSVTGTSNLATVATTGSYNDLLNQPALFSGAYADLSGTPTIPSAQIQSDWNQASNVALDFIKNKPTIPSAYTLPTATTSVLGGVKVDGTTITIADGVISSVSTDPNLWVETFAMAPLEEGIVQIATSVEYDASGNIFALFSHYVPGPDTNSSDDDITYTSVAKLTPAGAVIWRVRFANTLNTDGWGLAYDSADAVYIAGQQRPNSLTYRSATLTKIDAVDGSIVWSKTYDFGYYSGSPVVDVDVDGNPIMVGYADNSIDSMIVTSKIDQADGTVIWSKTLDGQGDDQAYGMAVGPTGEIVTIGYVDRIGVQDAVATVVTIPPTNPNWTDAYSVSNGSFSCNITFASPGNPTFSNVVDTVGNRTIGDTLVTVMGSDLGGMDGDDDMIINVATLAPNDTVNRMIVIKYAADGTITWRKAVQFDIGLNCTGADADIDADGNIYVCGNYDTSGGDVAMGLLKLDSSGVKQWSRRVQGDCLDFATSVVVGPDNNLYLSGVTGRFGLSDFVWVVAKYSTAGTVIWQRLIDNTASWTFNGGIFFNNSGGSNLAVRNEYVALAGGFGNLDLNEPATATVVQIDTNGTMFTVSDWAITGALFTGSLNATASDITVVNVGKTSNTVTPGVADFVVEEDATNFLSVTRYNPSGIENASSINNGAYSVSVNTLGVVTMETSRGSLEFGALPEVGGTTHFHIMKAAGDTADLFLGDDYNYVLQRGPAYLGSPAYGVEIGTNDNDGGDQHVWRFGTDGSLTVPGDINSITDISIVAGSYLPITGVNVQTVDELVPPGDVWRIFIIASNYSSLSTIVQVGDTFTTSWGTPITATITNIVQDIGAGTWALHTNQDIVTGFDAGPQTVTFNSVPEIWQFGTDGAVTFPDTTVQTTAYPGELVPANGDTVSGNANLVFYAGTDWYNTSKVTINPTSSMLTLNGNSGTGGITFPDATVQTTAWAGGRVVAVPTVSTGAAGNKQGDLAFNSSYIYYCTQNFTPSSYSSTIVLTYSGTYPTIVKGSIPQPQAGWELIHDGNTYILDANATEGNPGEWSLSLSSSISVTIGDSVTIGPASVPNIWKRVAWSGDTW